MDTVCAVSFTTVPVFLENVDSIFEPFDLSLTRMVESVSSWTSNGWKSTFGSRSKISMNFPTKLDFTVFGFFPICFSNGDLPSFLLLTLSVYRISDRSDLSFVSIIFLFARSLSLIVLINRSILPFPLCSLTGQVMCSIPNCLQNWANASLTNTVPGSVPIFLGTPYCAIYCFENSITFFVDGRCKNFAFMVF